ncbi:hypothetical protein I302_104499 [Kwoniella bestiolae CBS 10118]|uniref:Zn(2)-C6 fungal-type domain-containing protein n=1 Tax=Kwoniella bestiolae CBS 10118 TaxID=1296100 RepID=A0A1B9GBE9_9TREE|nr:hypothetical protein I302_03205 [Kwoniella bestiolae CBS 10118]OCF28346.1 hypothetical protein I302_03205 [Kwoniella bestiolae CBS 10118]
MPPIREPSACLRCRQRKIKCLGPTVQTPEGRGSCENCYKKEARCEFVPHRRGRKVGTKLSEDVKASLKEKYALMHPPKAQRPPSPRTPHHSDRVQHPASRVRTDDNPYRSTVHQVLPTSSIRVNYDHTPSNNYTHPNGSNSANNNNHDIGPSVSKISSISRLFTIKKPQDMNKRNAGGGFSLFREDPITCGYIDEATGRRLFDLFIDKLAFRVFIFDPDLHTYEYVQSTSNFLFCVMLAIAAKFDQSISRITHKKCLALAKDQMLRVFADNIESEETVQALYVLTEYREAEDENSYILLGMACRIAVDLDLASPRPDYNERQNRNRQRIWLVIFAADRRYNYCGQTAKPCMMPESALSRNASKFIESPLCLVPDYRLAGNVELRRMLAAHIEAIDRDNELSQGSYSLDVGAEYREMEKEADEWTKDQVASEPEMLIHAHLSALHAKVIIAHRWVQRLFRSTDSPNGSRSDDNHEADRREALSVCINGSLGILSVMLQLSDDTLRYACDSKHLYFAYASFFLHKIFDTNIASVMLDKQYITYFINLFERCAERLEQVTVSPTLTGAYHAAFLRGLMDICNRVLQNTNSSGEEPVSRRSSVGPDQDVLTQLQQQQQQHHIETATTDPTQIQQPLYHPDGTTDLSMPIESSLYNSAFDLGSGLDITDFSIPTIGNMILDPINTEDLTNLDISWNDWWPFDNQSWAGNSNGFPQFGEGDNQDWQGSIQAS